MPFPSHETIVAASLLVPALLLLYQYFFGTLHEIPGPLPARYSRLWYFLSLCRGKHEQDIMALHRKHGKIVRTAPNQYSIDDPDATKIIYGRGSRFNKAEWYKGFEKPDQPTIFSVRDTKGHDKMRKKLHKYYTMSVMTSYEHYVDNCVSLLSQRFSEMAESRKTINLAWWLQLFAFDVIGEITYSKRFGFLDSGSDVDKLIENVHKFGRYAPMLGIFHEVHNSFFAIVKNLSRLGIGSGNPGEYIRDYTFKSWEQRKAQIEKSDDDPHILDEEDPSRPKDFLTKFVEISLKDPESFNLRDGMNGIGGNFFAGSDTTSITLSALFYQLLTNPETLKKLRAELREHDAAGTVSDPVTFKEAQNVEYLQAVVKETLRINPAVGMMLPRVVPAGGALISGHYLPAGSVVGINAWVAHRNTEVFGDDATIFKPERWLKTHADEATLARMEQYFMPFGLGSRVCLGRNVSLLEITKLVPEIVKRFDFELSDEVMREGVKTMTEFFVFATNLSVKVVKR